MEQKEKYSFDAVVFDLDGVITKTALVHASAWKEMFDEYLRLREKRDNEPFKEFTHENDYLPYVDGKPRYKGVQSFLGSRGIDLPFGDPSDAPDKETACGLGNKKNVKFKEILRTDGVDVYALAINFVNDLRLKGIHTAVASSSKNCKFILEKIKIEDLFETRVGGIVSAELGLQGKPEPDIFITAAKNLGVNPDRAVVVEDAISGVQAGANGGFALVLGIAREDNEKELKENGADVVVTSLEGVTSELIDKWVKEKKGDEIK